MLARRSTISGSRVSMLRPNLKISRSAARFLHLSTTISFLDREGQLEVLKEATQVRVPKAQSLSIMFKRTNWCRLQPRSQPRNLSTNKVYNSQPQGISQGKAMGLRTPLVPQPYQALTLIYSKQPRIQQGTVDSKDCKIKLWTPWVA